jgi:hypothetical protein
VRHVRMLGLCLVATLALGAYAVSSASALEWGKCEKLETATGNYTGPNCTKAEKAKPKGSGSYEWRKGSELAPVPFTGHNVGSGGVLYTEFPECRQESPPYEVFASRLTRKACEEKGAERVLNGSGPAIECTAESNTGEASGKNEVKNVHVTFTGCLLLGSVPCENGAAEEIKTNELKGKLGYISKPNKEVGVLLEPAKKHGAFAEFVCPGFGISVAVGVGNKKEGAAHTSSGCTGACPGTTPEEEKHGGYDGVISPITPVNEMTSTYTQEYKVVNGGAGEPCPENTPSKFEGKHIELLEDFQYLTSEPTTSLMAACSGEEITNVNTPSEPGEIKA